MKKLNFSINISLFIYFSLYLTSFPLQSAINFSELSQNLVNNNGINRPSIINTTGQASTAIVDAQSGKETMTVWSELDKVSRDKDIWQEGDKVQYGQLNQKNAKNQQSINDQLNQSQNNNAKAPNLGDITARIIDAFKNSKFLGGLPIPYNNGISINEHLAALSSEVNNSINAAYDPRTYMHPVIREGINIQGIYLAARHPILTMNAIKQHAGQFWNDVRSSDPAKSGPAKMVISKVIICEAICCYPFGVRSARTFNALLNKGLSKKDKLSTSSGKFNINSYKATETREGFKGQFIGNLDELYKYAKISDKELKRITKEIAKRTSGKVKFASIKNKKRALEKIGSDYKGDTSQLLDIARASIVFNKKEDIYRAAYEIAKNCEIVRIKDRFIKPGPVGYRDIMINIKTSDGHIVEMQLHLKSILKAKALETVNYNRIRTIESIAKKEGRALTSREVNEIFNLRKESSKLYENALNN